MSAIVTSRTLVDLEVEDEEGQELGWTCTVEVVYLTETDTDYGADADGRRGTTLVEVSVIDCAIDIPSLLRLTSWQVENLLARAHERVLAGKC